MLEDTISCKCDYNMMRELNLYTEGVVRNTIVVEKGRFTSQCTGCRATEM